MSPADWPVNGMSSSPRPSMTAFNRRDDASAESTSSGLSRSMSTSGVRNDLGTPKPSGRLNGGITLSLFTTLTASVPSDSTILCFHE